MNINEYIYVYILINIELNNIYVYIQSCIDRGWFGKS